MATDPVIELARRKKAGTHTRELHHVEHLPEDMQKLILETASIVSAQALKIVALEKAVADLQALVSGLGEVTLNDLMRKSA